MPTAAPARTVLPPGALAPDFTLRDNHGQEVTLSRLRGHPVALVFYPFAFSRICSSELCEIRDNLAAFEHEGARVLAVSVDHMFALRAYAEAEGFSFPLLSDYWPHGAVARSYGVFDEAGGFALRGTFLIDAAGVVRWSVVHGVGQARDLAGYRAALRELGEA